jgi:hypothetical protein
MTTAPQNLKDVRTLLLAHLDIHENSAAYPTDLDPAEVGIVGDPAHRGGYHCGSDRVVDGDYSVVESTRDRSSLTGYASALDVGQFDIRIGGKAHNLRSFSIWLVAQCKGNSADTRDIRELIYSPDGTTVKRWDRLGRRSTGDSSHRWHTHISYHRDAIKAGRAQTAPFRRYLTEIGLIQAPTAQEIDMEQTEKLVQDTGFANRTVGHVLADLENLRNTLLGVPEAKAAPAGSPLEALLATPQAVGDLAMKVNTLVTRPAPVGGSDVDYGKLADLVAGKLDALIAARMQS